MIKDSIAVMQPYFFPYLGYFQLINAVERFVFYDDVNFIKNGWINRNRIIINRTSKYITVPLSGASPFMRIDEVKHGLNNKNRAKILKTVYFNYSKAPHFDKVYPIIEFVLNIQTEYISEVAVNSVNSCLDYLKINKKLYQSSINFSESRELGPVNRLIDICTQTDSKVYVNPIGGKELYRRQDFEDKCIELMFLRPNLSDYNQNSSIFEPGLSIIDVLMFNDPETVSKNLMNDFDLC